MKAGYERDFRDFELKKKKWPQIESYLSRESVGEVAPNKERSGTEHLAAAVASIERRLNGLTEAQPLSSAMSALQRFDVF